MIGNVQAGSWHRPVNEQNRAVKTWPTHSRPDHGIGRWKNRTGLWRHGRHIPGRI